MRRRDRLRHTANWLNLTTPVGLLVAGLGGAHVRRSPDGFYIAERYRFRFPVAGAFTIGDVVITASTLAALERNTPGVVGHELRHAAQYAVGGVWFLPAYLAASAWSLVRTGNPALANPLERHAGLITGGYVHHETGHPLGPIWTFRGAPGLSAALRPARRRAGAARSGSAGAGRAGGADA